jgi:RNA polymerase sigma-70 factor (ECF subfamily)
LPSPKYYSGGAVIDDADRPEGSAREDLESLMSRYQESDSTAATLLAGRLNGRLLRFFAAQVKDRDRAQDLLQDCWLRIHRARHTYRSGEPLLPWVYAIARRVQVDDYRKVQRIRRHELQEEVKEPAAPVAPEPPASSRTLSVTELLERLPPPQREAILLLKVSGLTLEEVARATGTTVGAVKQRAHRAYTNLRRLFGEEK